MGLRILVWGYRVSGKRSSLSSGFHLGFRVGGC